MAAHIQPCIVLYLLLLSIISAINQSYSQSTSPQNIETFYPFSLPPLFPPSNWSDRPFSPPPSPSAFPESPPPALPPAQERSSSSKKAVGTAIGVTAATTLVVAGLLFCLLLRFMRRKKKDGDSPQISNPVVFPPNEFVRFNGDLKGMIIDENGLDVLYWKRLEGQDAKNGFKKQIVKYAKSEEKEEEKRMINKKSGFPIQEVPLLKGESSTSQSPVRTHMEDANYDMASIPARADLKAMGKQPLTVLPENDLPFRTASPIPQPPSPPKVQTPAPPPPPPLIPPKSPAPPPPPLPKTSGVLTSLKPPASKQKQSDGEQGPSSRDGESGTGNGQVKFKPLHWDKVNANPDHSMVWTKLEGGSFKVDYDLMEALFGYVATNKKSPKNDSNSSKQKGNKYSPPSQIFILDTRKSQNIAIVLRSLAITREEIIGALTDGHSLDTDTLEKLNRIAPTNEEESDILAFDGDIRRLADAESFLFHILKAVPSAFLRFNAMLFRSNYDSELSPFKESLQTLESACKELRARGIFLKLLEAILKAGNRMNAGTARGNAQAFNLTALRKLSDVKSIDGKTTLLHFVVEEVVRAEGKRCVLNKSNSLSRSNSRNSSSSSQIPDSSVSRDEREKEFIMLGLPVVGGLSVEFSNVKKAAAIDYDTFAKTTSALTTRAAEVRKLVAQCGDDGGRFAREMKRFLDVAEKEIKLMGEEQTRVMELVKRTTDYYQAGASKDKDAYSLQLFVIVKDFLSMVDQACVDIARNMQKRKSAAVDMGLSPRSPNSRAVKFPVLPPNFLSDSSKSSSSDSGDDS